VAVRGAAGFRRGEICTLADTDVDTEGAKVTVSADFRGG